MPGIRKRILVWFVERAIECVLFAILLFAIYGDEGYAGWQGTWGNLQRYFWLALVGMGYTGYGIATWILAIWGIARSRNRMITHVALFSVLLLVYAAYATGNPKVLPLLVVGAGIVALASYLANRLLLTNTAKAVPVA